MIFVRSAGTRTEFLRICSELTTLAFCYETGRRDAETWRVEFVHSLIHSNINPLETQVRGRSIRTSYLSTAALLAPAFQPPASSKGLCWHLFRFWRLQNCTTNVIFFYTGSFVTVRWSQIFYTLTATRTRERNHLTLYDHCAFSRLLISTSLPAASPPPALLRRVHRLLRSLMLSSEHVTTCSHVNHFRILDGSAERDHCGLKNF